MKFSLRRCRDQLNANWRIAANYESAMIKNRKRNDPRANVNQSVLNVLPFIYE